MSETSPECPGLADKSRRSFTAGDLDTAIVRVAAVLEPISEEAQVWASLLKTASEMANIAVSVYLEPDVQNTEVSGYSSL